MRNPCKAGIAAAQAGNRVAIRQLWGKNSCADSEREEQS
jgi:hypothetical protein